MQRIDAPRTLPTRVTETVSAVTDTVTERLGDRLGDLGGAAQRLAAMPWASRGVAGGRRWVRSEADVRAVLELSAAGHTTSEIARLVGVAGATGGLETTGRG